MDPKLLRRYFDDPESAVDWLTGWEIVDPKIAIKNLVSMAAYDPSLEAFAPFVDSLAPLIRFSADPDMVLNNLERFFRMTRSPLTLISLFQRDRMALASLSEIFSTSQYLSDVLINDPELFETVRQTEGKPVPFHQMLDELVGEVDALEKGSLALRSLRRFKRRHILRIAYGDIIRKQSLEIVTRQLSNVADVIIEAALHAAGHKLFQKRGTPRAPDGAPAHFTILALGKLGGQELNYSSDIDLMFLYDAEGMTDLNPIPNSQYFAELGREIVRLLTAPTELGAAYRVDMRLRPNGQHGSLAIGLEEALRYYDNRGRTWERQAFIKARPVAGNLELGRFFLKRLEPWIYRKAFTQSDIAGIRSLKRKIERNVRNEGEELLNVKTGFGGIRDIEFTVQFLQLLHGGALPQLRIGNTLHTIEQLEKEGCLKLHESELLFEAYRFLRKIEHRLQIMFDLQTHLMPKSFDGRRKLAMRMDYNDMSGQTALACFDHDFKYMTGTNRKMLNHLLIDAFHDDDETAAEIDLLLDPEPEESRIKAVLEKYRFDDPIKAYRLLVDLADEKNPFFFARRCRHFLVAIAPELLRAVALTPDPMQTLKTLATVADALGEKGGLWELFSFNPPSLRLFVRFCALTPFLTDLLCRDPGMFDGLMDCLVADKLPPRHVLYEYITRLVSGAEQIEPILSGFKNDMMLIAGVRDVLGKSDSRETTGLLSDIAEFCLQQITLAEYHKMVSQYGIPVIGPMGRGPNLTDQTVLVDSRSAIPSFHGQTTTGSEEPIPCRFSIIGLGKFGGREMNYHSDLDLLFVYEADGVTTTTSVDDSGFSPVSATESVANQVFFSLLAQRIVKRVHQFGPWGKLYDVDLRLRPMGKSGSLATPLAGLVRYFKEGHGELWERQMLCKARVVFSGDQLLPAFVVESGTPMNHLVLETIRRIQNENPLPDDWVKQLRTMRKRLSDSSPDDDLKRGSGGTVDVEFIVQMLQLKHGNSRPGISVPNTFDALEKLGAAGILGDDDKPLRDGYRFLRTLESFLRLMNMPSTKQIPTNPHELKKLAILAGFASVEELTEKIEETTNEITNCFNRFFC